MNKIIISLFLLFATSFAIGQSTKNNVAKIGAKVPDFKFGYLENNTSHNATLSEFNNSLIILDFWATWCGPCLEGLPKMEKLQKEFGNKIKILTITDEKRERITAFLSKRPIGLPVILDSNRTLNDYFKHASIPHYVILDKNKTIKAITSGEYITSENINKLLKNQAVDIVEKKDDMNFDPQKSLSNNNNNYLFQSILTPYHIGYPGMSNIPVEGVYANRRILATNLTATKLIEIAYQFEYTRVVEEVSHPEKYKYEKDNLYCYEIIVPENLKEKKFQIMQSELSKIFGLSTAIEKRKVACYVLKQDTSLHIKLEQSKSESKESFIRYGEGITLINKPINDLCKFLENNLNKPVLDETGLLGMYDIDIKWRQEDPDNLKTELAKYGFFLEKAEREVDMLIIRD